MSVGPCSALALGCRLSMMMAWRHSGLARLAPALTHLIILCAGGRAQGGHAECVRWLLTRRPPEAAGVHAAEAARGWTALHFACAAGHAAVGGWPSRTGPSLSASVVPALTPGRAKLLCY
jgi:hypothetical protein